MPPPNPQFPFPPCLCLRGLSHPPFVPRRRSPQSALTLPPSFGIGDPRNLLKSGRGERMDSGWETARQPGRPHTISVDPTTVRQHEARTACRSSHAPHPWRHVPTTPRQTPTQFWPRHQPHALAPHQHPSRPTVPTHPTSPAAHVPAPHLPAPLPPTAPPRPPVRLPPPQTDPQPLLSSPPQGFVDHTRFRGKGSESCVLRLAAQARDIDEVAHSPHSHAPPPASTCPTLPHLPAHLLCIVPTHTNPRPLHVFFSIFRSWSTRALAMPPFPPERPPSPPPHE